MSNRSVNIHFVIAGDARARLGDEILRMPPPPAEVGFIPVVGDFIKISGLESFSLVVVAREVEFQEAALEVTCYLDSAPKDRRLPSLRSVK